VTIDKKAEAEARFTELRQTLGKMADADDKVGIDLAAIDDVDDLDDLRRNDLKRSDDTDMSV